MDPGRFWGGVGGVQRGRGGIEGVSLQNLTFFIRGLHLGIFEWTIDGFSFGSFCGAGAQIICFVVFDCCLRHVFGKSMRWTQ